MPTKSPFRSQTGCSVPVSQPSLVYRKLSAPLYRYGIRIRTMTYTKILKHNRYIIMAVMQNSYTTVIVSKVCVMVEKDKSCDRIIGWFPCASKMAVTR